MQISVLQIWLKLQIRKRFGKSLLLENAQLLVNRVDEEIYREQEMIPAQKFHDSFTEILSNMYQKIFI